MWTDVGGKIMCTRVDRIQLGCVHCPGEGGRTPLKMAHDNDDDGQAGNFSCLNSRRRVSISTAG